jgi:hypothetical protein
MNVGIECKAVQSHLWENINQIFGTVILKRLLIWHLIHEKTMLNGKLAFTLSQKVDILFAEN